MKRSVGERYAVCLGGLTVLFGLHNYDNGNIPMMTVGISLSLSGLGLATSAQSLYSVLASVPLLLLLVGARP